MESIKRASRRLEMSEKEAAYEAVLSCLALPYSVYYLNLRYLTFRSGIPGKAGTNI